MTVIVLVAAPPGLRGHLTRWMVEVQAGVFVGNPGRRIRDRLWIVLAERIREQGWTTRTAGTHRWYPVDFDGLMLIARPRKQKA